MQLRLIGDVHQKIKDYIKLLDAPYSIQLGDMGFDYSLLNQVDASKHKFLAGNHDNYSISEYVDDKPSILISENERYAFSEMPAHYLGNYGLFRVPETDQDIFFVRGAYSIDWRYRTIGIDLFEYEELSNYEMSLALDLYLKTKPRFVISHDAPLDATKNICSFLIKNRTAYLLQEMFENHQPELWVFGHHHVSISKIIGNTQFICLPELGVLDLEF